MLEPIYEFSKAAEYKINMQKSVAFLYANNEAAEKEIEESIPFAIASKTMLPRNKPNQRGEWSVL